MIVPVLFTAFQEAEGFWELLSFSHHCQSDGLPIMLQDLSWLALHCEPQCCIILHAILGCLQLMHVHPHECLQTPAWQAFTAVLFLKNKLFKIWSGKAACGLWEWSFLQVIPGLIYFSLALMPLRKKSLCKIVLFVLEQLWLAAVQLTGQTVFRMGECDPLFSCWVTPSSCHWSHVKAVTELIKQLVIWVLEKGNVQYAVLGAYCLPTAFTGFWIRPIRLPVLLALTCSFQWMLCSGAGCSGEASLSSQGCSTQCVVAV